MLRPPRALVAIAAGATLVASGCNKPPPPKIDAATEQAEALKRAKERAYGGNAVKALEMVKALEADMNKKAEEDSGKAEK